MSRSLIPQIIALRDRGLSKRQVAEALGIRYEALKSTTHRAGIEFGRPTAVVAPAVAKVCAHCGRPFTRRRGEDNTAFQRRVTCGTACGGILAARTRAALRATRPVAKQEIPLKRCEVCGGQFRIRHTEGPKHFEARKTCRPECARVLQRETNRRLRERRAYVDQPWPVFGRPGELAPNAFAAHEIEPPPEYGSLPPRGVDRTLGGVVSYGGRGAA